MIHAILCGLLLSVATANPATEHIYTQEEIKAKITAAGMAEDHEGAASVVVLEDAHVRVRDTGLATTDSLSVVKILKESAAKSLAVQRFDYDPDTYRVAIKEVRVHREDGSTDDVPVHSLNSRPSPASMIYWGNEQMLLQLPRLEVGDALEIVESKTGFNIAYLNNSSGGGMDTSGLNPPMPGHWHETVYFQEGRPILEKNYTVRISKDIPLQYLVEHGTLRSSLVIDGADLVYRWEARDVEPLPSEPDRVATSDIALKLVLATVPTWEEKSIWFHDANQRSFDTNPEITAMSKKIVAGINDEIEKIRAINCWVADNVRYIGSSRGPCEGYTIHKADETFLDRGGVCKDKAGMAVTMLRAIGMESYAVLTQAGSDVEDIPADQFNHTVGVVKMSDGSWQLIDPTWSPKSRELWSSREAEQPIVFGLPDGADLDKSPYFPPSYNAVNANLTSRIDETGRLVSRIRMDMDGYACTYFRRGIAKEPAAHERDLLEATLRSSYGPALSLEGSQCTSPTDYSRPSHAEMRVSINNYMIGGGEIRMFKLPGLQHPLSPLVSYDIIKKQEADSRKTGMRLRASRLLKYSETIELPDGWELVELPDRVEIDHPAASLNFTIDQSGNRITYNYELQARKHIVPEDEYPGYKEVNNAMTRLTDSWVVCRATTGLNNTGGTVAGGNAAAGMGR
jgi:hypothetical protein